METSHVSTFASEILEEIKTLLHGLISGKKCRRRKVVVNAEEVPSAQQCVFILTVEDSVEEILDDIDEHCMINNFNLDEQSKEVILAGLGRGNGKLVVKIWKGSARWWNLNSNSVDSPSKIARLEVAGYKDAGLSIQRFNEYGLLSLEEKEGKHVVDEILIKSPIIIPEILFFSLDNVVPNQQNEFYHPWALIEFIGNDTYYLTKNEWIQDNHFIRNMIKDREEFGFVEPHPRHGRVSVELCLDYALHVLKVVILPIHCAFFLRSFSNNFLKDKEMDTDNVCNTSRAQNIRSSPYRYHDMVSIYSKALAQLKHKLPSIQNDINSCAYVKLKSILFNYEMCVKRLVSESQSMENNIKNDIPPVLCHMDLQPQNMIFIRKKITIDSVNDFFGNVNSIASVLDWEEACYADPRFDLILFCRKVLANRGQADFIWDQYAKSIKSVLKVKQVLIGNIEPWLKLECVHSLTTLVLQAMDLIGGGRNPWEKKIDLFAKIDREFSR
eukprot:CAMPEP_0184867022 /NCGR_PEP_ID=MMETSP0580-20130426/24760_1 /TAXON_ID=1118495 /ORGANISM="Dactyliosolen fragilissimus" /LENGTH=497 /DNA_ID=CAMNT_0027367017 /DNA_START=51 /DNA_END=1540 /DNA_ORIENTATION=+